MRKLTWIIVAANVLFLAWAITVLAADLPGPGCFRGFIAGSCAEGGRTGASLQLVVTLWAVVDVVLGALWTVTSDGRET